MPDERPAPATPPDAHRVAQLLSQAEHRVTRALSLVLRGDGATVEQWRILALLADGASHPMSEIAEHALLSPPTLTRLIDRMVADNLAYRTADPQDRRRVLVRLTARGAALHARLARRMADQGEAILAAAEAAGLAQLAAMLADRAGEGA